VPVFLLVHGAQHGAWCWDKTLERLRALGHEAHAIDLPGHCRSGGDARKTNSNAARL